MDFIIPFDQLGTALSEEKFLEKGFPVTGLISPNTNSTYEINRSDMEDACAPMRVRVVSDDGMKAVAKYLASVCLSLQKEVKDAGWGEQEVWNRVESELWSEYESYLRGHGVQYYEDINPSDFNVGDRVFVFDSRKYCTVVEINENDSDEGSIKTDDGLWHDSDDLIAAY